MEKVFLGGTCNGSSWRDELIPFLEEHKIKYFNPVVEDWTPECQAEEYRQKKDCDFHLYVITADMTGVFSIAEAVDSAHLEDKQCLFQVILEGFDKGQYKSLIATSELIHKRGGWSYIGTTFDRLIKFLVDHKESEIKNERKLMSNDILNLHIDDDSPCGENAVLYEIAEFYANILLFLKKYYPETYAEALINAQNDHC